MFLTFLIKNSENTHYDVGKKNKNIFVLKLDFWHVIGRGGIFNTFLNTDWQIFFKEKKISEKCGLWVSC